MNNGLNINHLFMPGVPPKVGKPLHSSQAQPIKQQGVSFQNILDSKLLKFSNHAETRLKQRGIELKPEQLTKLETAVTQAASKGAKASLLLMSDMAFIVNVPNRTVVTAMDGSSLKDNVFTQIDSAVIVS